MYSIVIWSIVFVVWTLWIALWQDITFSPLYPDYTDSYVLPAWCEILVDVDIDVWDNKISEVRSTIWYDRDDLTFARILQKTKSSKVRHRDDVDGIVYTQKASSGETLKHVSFSLVFVSALQEEQEKNKETMLSLVWEKSYLMTIDGDSIPLEWEDVSLEFAYVPTCTPDTIDPRIELLTPSEDEIVPVNQAISLRVQDFESGIDWDSLVIQLDWLRYQSWDDNVTIKNGIVHIDPLLDYARGTSVQLKVTVSDLEQFPWVNTITRAFEFTTNTDTPMCQEMWCSVSLGRKLSEKECVQLQKLYVVWDETSKRTLQNLVDDLQFSCSFANLDEIQKWFDRASTKDTQPRVQKQAINILSLAWWVLFAIVFFLKLYYIKQTRKYKKKLSQK